MAAVALFALGLLSASMPSNIEPWGQWSERQVASPKMLSLMTREGDSRRCDRHPALCATANDWSRCWRASARSAPFSVFAFSPTTDLARGSWSAQNQWVQVAAEAGIPGLVAFLAFVRALIAGGRRIASGHGCDVTFGQAVNSYVIAIVIGNQSAVWLLPMASSGYVMLALAGISSSFVAPPARRFRQHAKPRRPFL